ncbi:MAG: HDOD domain-containing protein [Oscillospiraceae bacterium]|jgi:EAL and modified HD-GYP domain-containing signal transduction protein|nr:HDOD domain-containing protein [Oscillospiraceae bacterium]
MENTKYFIVASPLFDKKINSKAYYLQVQNSERLFDAGSDFQGLGDAMNAPHLELLSALGTEPFASDLPLLVEHNEYQLLAGLPATLGFSPEHIIVVIGKEVPISGAVFMKCMDLKDKGYKLAANGILPGVSPDLFFELFNYLILDYEANDFKRDFGAMRPHIFKIKFIINNIPDMDAFNTLTHLHEARYSGKFYSSPVDKDAGDIAPLKINALHLLSQINQEDFEITEAAAIIERDPALSISLLKFINRAGGFRGVKKVENIRQAVVIMGQREIRRWAAVAITTQLAEDRPSEITRLSLIRAKFAENLAYAYELGTFAPLLFIAGLFSLLDVILEKPMEEAINEVAVDPRVHRALVEQKGEMYEVLDLVYNYEKCNWIECVTNLYRNKVTNSEAIKAFMDALIWYREMLETIDEDDVETEHTAAGA